MSHRVLLVDDDRDIALGASVRLRASGYEVATAQDGQEGLDRALADPPDVIVIDIRMPKKDGLTLLAELREDERTRGLPAVVLTAEGIEENRVRALEMGAKFMRKPYDPKRLVALLDETLRRAS